MLILFHAGFLVSFNHHTYFVLRWSFLCNCLWLKRHTCTLADGVLSSLFSRSPGPQKWKRTLIYDHQIKMLEQSPVNQTRHSGTSTANVRLEYTIVKLSHPLDAIFGIIISISSGKGCHSVRRNTIRKVTLEINFSCQGGNWGKDVTVYNDTMVKISLLPLLLGTSNSDQMFFTLKGFLSACWLNRTIIFGLGFKRKKRLDRIYKKRVIYKRRARVKCA